MKTIIISRIDLIYSPKKNAITVSDYFGIGERGRARVKIRERKHL